MSREWLALFRLPRHSHLTHAYGPDRVLQKCWLSEGL
jgi:hypothetical protein